MSDLTSLLYFRTHDMKSVLTIVNAIVECYGGQLTYPETADVVVLSDVGDQIRMTRSSFLQRIGTVERISFQWWLNEFEDVYSRFRKADGHVVAEIGMDGMDENQISRFEVCALKELKRCFGSDTLDGFVLGTDCIEWQKGNWDEFLLGDDAAVQPPKPPSVLGVPANKPYQHASTSSKSESHGRYLLYYKARN